MSKYFKNIIIFVMCIMGYELIHFVFNINNMILPSISSILIQVDLNFKSLVVNVLYTLLEVILGLSIAIVFSIMLVIIINEFWFLKKPFIRCLSIFQMIPLISIAPLIIIWFGLGMYPKILLIVLYASFPIVISLVQGFEDVDPELLDYMLSLNPTMYKKYKYLFLYLSKGAFYGGLKISVTYVFVTAITVEYLGGTKGVGVMISRAYNSYNTPLVFGFIIIIVLITIGFLNIINKREDKFR